MSRQASNESEFKLSHYLSDVAVAFLTPTLQHQPMRLKARITLLPTAESGHRGPITSDYRPDWDIGDRVPEGGIDYRMRRIMDLELEFLAPGHECDAEIEPLWPERWQRVKPGDRLTFFEGPRTVGYAVVLSIVA